MAYKMKPFVFTGLNSSDICSLFTKVVPIQGSFVWKPQGGSKVNSVFDFPNVYQMGTRNSWGLSS